ncbi:trypsin-like serine peptidase [Streptomyces sp. NPDC002073]
MRKTRIRGAAGAAAAVVLAGAAGCGPVTAAGDSVEAMAASSAPPAVRTVVQDGAVTVKDRRAAEAYWAGGAMEAIARVDAKDDLVPPAWTGGGSIARTVGRLFAMSGADGTPAACTATLVGSRTVITAAHCVRTSTEGSPDSAAAWDRNLFFVPGYRAGKGPHGGFTVRRVRMAEDWGNEGRDLAMLEMNPSADGRTVTEAVGGPQPISFTAQTGAGHFFGYPYTDWVLHCSGATSRGAIPALVRIPCLMGSDRAAARTSPAIRPRAASSR